MHGSTPPYTPVAGTAEPLAEPLAYSAKKAAERLELSLRTVRKLIATGEIRSFKVGHARRISRDALHDYVQRQHA